MKCPQCGEADAWKARELSENRINGDIVCGCTTCAHRWIIRRDGSLITIYEGHEEKVK